MSCRYCRGVLQPLGSLGDLVYYRCRHCGFTQPKENAMHPSITLDRIMELAERSMFGCSEDGICTACGEEQMGVEPDAEGYECECCGEHKVMGAELLLLKVQP